MYLYFKHIMRILLYKYKRKKYFNFNSVYIIIYQIYYYNSITHTENHDQSF